MSDNDKLEIILKKLREKAAELFGDALVKVFLYGSYARGDYHEWSDVDIMVLVNCDQQTLRRRERELWRYSSDLCMEYDVVLSVIVNSYVQFENWKNTLPFYANISSEGVEIGGRVQ